MSEDLKGNTNFVFLKNLQDELIVPRTNLAAVDLTVANGVFVSGNVLGVHIATADDLSSAVAGYIADAAVVGPIIAGEQDIVSAGDLISLTGATIDRKRYMPIKSAGDMATVSKVPMGGSAAVTYYVMEPGNAYRLMATSSKLYLATQDMSSITANPWALESHLELFVAAVGNVQTDTNVVLADPLEPSSVNNCTVRFHDGKAIISVEDHIAGSVVTVNAATDAVGTLKYYLQAAPGSGDETHYISFDAALNGQTLDMGDAVTSGEKHVVGNGYSATVLTGGVSCTSKTTFSNLGMGGVVVAGGTLTLGDAYIPQGGTVSVSGGGLAIEKVSGNGGVIDLGGTNIKLTGIATCNVSGCTFVSGYGAGSGGGAFFNSNTLSAHIQLTGCEISGCSATRAGAVLVAAASATLTNCDVIGNRADGLGGGIMIGAGKAFLSSCTIIDNFASNTATTPPANDLQFNGVGSAVLLGGNTLGYAQIANGGNVIMSGTNKVTGVFQYRGPTNSGTVTLTSGAILDLTGNANTTPIAPGGGITFESGGATVKVGDSTASSSYMMDNVTLPGMITSQVVESGVTRTVVIASGAKLTNTAVVDLGGTTTAACYGSASGIALPNGKFTLSGGVAFNVRVNSGGILDVRSGGSANSTTVNSKGLVYIYRTCTANDTTVKSGGNMIAVTQSTVNNTTVNAGGRFIVYTNAVANEPVISSGGSLVVSSGASALEVTSMTGAVVTVEDGGYITYKE